MTEKLLQMMQEKGYFNQHKKVLVAVSGGADSMSLLHFLYNHQKDLDIQLGIAHVNHKQRQESEYEEDYLRLKDSYILTPEKLQNAKHDLCIMHPLPRVNEIAAAVDSDPRACYFKQVLYGKFIRMALILMLLEVEA